MFETMESRTLFSADLPLTLPDTPVELRATRAFIVQAPNEPHDAGGGNAPERSAQVKDVADNIPRVFG